MRRRILLVGASGAFGARLAGLLARWEDVELVLAARRAEPLERLRRDLAGDASARLVIAQFDRTRPDDLADLAPWAVVDAAGPFQASDFRLPLAAVAAGAHYVDIADARAFVAAFPTALDASAKGAGVLAITGASSTPALSNAAADTLVAGWGEVSSLTVAICPGARAPRGRSVVEAILSYVGRPIRVFANGGWTERPGWSGPRRLTIPNLGRRWASLCETPDLDILPARFRPQQEALFLAGLELGVMHLGLWMFSWFVRLRLIASLEPLASVLRSAAGVLERFGSDRGGMLVEAHGRGASGQPVRACWSLAAEANAGPTVPVAAAAAVLRALKDGRLAGSGGVVCAGLLPLDLMLAELSGLPITSRLERGGVGVFRQALGDGFAALPTSVARVHGEANRFRGRACARGSRGTAIRLLRWMLGLPEPGAYPEIEVEIALQPGGAEIWSRRFGRSRFSSRLKALDAPGCFEERFGPVRFRFDTVISQAGFRWMFRGWSLGPLPLPKALAPRIRARAFEADGGYRFRVLASHPWLGVLFAYAGRLD